MNKSKAIIIALALLAATGSPLMGQVQGDTCLQADCACWWLVFVDDYELPQTPFVQRTPASPTSSSKLAANLHLNVEQGRPSSSGEVEDKGASTASSVLAHGTAIGSARIQVLHKNTCKFCDKGSTTGGKCAAWIAGASSPTAIVAAEVGDAASVYQQVQINADFRFLTGASQHLRHIISMSGSRERSAISTPRIIVPFQPVPFPLSTDTSRMGNLDRVSKKGTTLSSPVKRDQGHITWEEVILKGVVNVSLAANTSNHLFYARGFARCSLKKASHNVTLAFGCNCTGTDHAMPTPLLDLGYTPLTGGGVGGATPPGGAGSGGSTGGTGSLPKPLRPTLWLGGTVPCGPTPTNAQGERSGPTPMLNWDQKGHPYPFSGGHIAIHTSK